MRPPPIQQVADESGGRYKDCAADVDQAPGLVQQFRIMSVPTLVLLRDGQEADRLVGGQSKEQILAALEALEERS